jgi:HAE1 family hydrophobic/amphiphilic exporter-1
MAKFFINYPIVAMVISILMVIVGAISLIFLPVAQYPDITPPEIRVEASYTGADAQTIEQSVATPIEQRMSGVDNMNYMYSVNSNDGQMVLTVNFDVTTDPNTDQILTQLRQSQAASQLPAEVNALGVTVVKSLAAPLMILALNSPDGTRDAAFLSNYSRINIQDQLSRIPGIARVQSFGAGEYAMRLWVKPDQLAKLRITVPEIISAVQAQNTVNPAGKIGGEPVPQGQEYTYTALAESRLVSEEEFAEIVIRETPDGGTVRIKDVARIEMGAQDYSYKSRFDGNESGVILLYQLPGSNALDAAAGVKKAMTEMKKRFPSGVDYAVALDTTLAVSEGISEIVTTLLIALVLVIIVVYIFLQGWRPTLIPLLAVPVSLVGTFIFFPLFGFSINTLSLFGLVLAIGLVVDDAIVVVEAVERHIEEGLSPRQATIKAMEEISGPVIGIALVLSAVFVPTAFIPGITGRLYQQFAMTIAISVILSAFNALTLSPALSALLLRPRKESRGPLRKFFDWFNRVFGRATDGYIGLSGLLIRKSAVSMALLAVFAVAVVFFNSKLPPSFLPEEDQGYFFVNLQLPNGASLQRTEEAVKKIEEILAITPGVDHTTDVVGHSVLSGVANTYSATFFVSLKEWGERTGTEEQIKAIQAHLNQELSKLPQGVAFSFSPPAIPGIGASGGFTFVLEDRSGGDIAFLDGNLKTFLAAARKRPELAGLSTTFLPSVPQVFVDVDRDKVLKLGVPLGDVYRTIQTFMGGSFINYFSRFGRQWRVYVQAEGEYRTKAENVGQFYVRNSSGQAVQLAALTKIEPRSGPEFTMRYNLYRGAQINGSAAPGYSSAQAMAALEQVFAETMPREMGYDYMGMSFQEKQAQEGVQPAVIFGASLLFVFLILAALYESWSLPFSVLLGVPVGVAGAFAALLIRGMESNVYAQIGLVMLIGLSAKNAILIVEFAKAEYEKGKPLIEAALTGARLRFRPILMTSFAFILGCVPLWIASGSGAVSRRVMGTTVMGGMLAATALAIFLIPVTFYLVERFTMRFSKAPPPEITPSVPEQAAGD